MRISVWDKPRVIGCAENYPQHIALPRGCFDAAMSLLRDNGIASKVQDERFGGHPLDVKFIGNLRMDQEVAISSMLRHDHGVVLVHRTELSKQWKERPQAFLGVDR